VRTATQPPPAGSLVMREGKRKSVEIVMKEADQDKREREDEGTWDGQYHLSVFAGPLAADEQPEQAVQRLFDGHLRVKWFRTGPLECFDRGGLRLSASPPEPYHYDVVIGPELTPDVVERFEQCFDSEVRRNPAWRAS
jgi:hypothetical protein